MYRERYASAASALFSAASSLAARSTLLSNYTIESATGPSSPSQSFKPVQVGPWRVERAKNNSSGRIVSIWTCDKATLAQGGSAGRRSVQQDAKRIDKAVEVLKKEVSRGPNDEKVNSRHTARRSHSGAAVRQIIP